MRSSKTNCFELLKIIAEISNSDLIRNANSLIAKNEVKIDPKVS